MSSSSIPLYCNSINMTFAQVAAVPFILFPSTFKTDSIGEKIQLVMVASKQASEKSTRCQQLFVSSLHLLTLHGAFLSTLFSAYMMNGLCSNLLVTYDVRGTTIMKNDSDFSFLRHAVTHSFALHPFWWECRQ